MSAVYENLAASAVILALLAGGLLRESPTAMQVLAGLGKWLATVLAIVLGTVLLAAIGHGMVAAIGLVPFLLLCLLIQGAGKSA